MTAWIHAQTATEPKGRSQRRVAVGRRAKERQQFVTEMAGKIQARFPCMPPGTAEEIASYIFKLDGLQFSLPDEQIDRAVMAHIRHCHTDYEYLLWNPHRLLYGDQGIRAWAREHVSAEVERIFRRWKGEIEETASEEVGEGVME